MSKIPSDSNDPLGIKVVIESSALNWTTFLRGCIVKLRK